MASNFKFEYIHWFCRQDMVPGVINHDDVLRNAHLEIENAGSISADQFVLANKVRYWNDLRKHSDSLEDRGIPCLINVIDDSSRRFEYGAYGLRRSSIRSHKILGVRLERRPSILRMIQDLGDRDYEAVGCVLSEFLGARHTHLTPQGREAGIDFVALLKLNGSSHIFGGGQGELRVVGQSKKWKSRVKQATIHEFATVLDMVHNLNRLVLPHLPNWFRESRAPIIGCLVSHVGFQSGAIRSAADRGIVLIDSLDVSHCFALSRRIPINAPLNEVVGACKSKIAECFV